MKTRRVRLIPSECPGTHGGRTGGSERQIAEGRCSDVETSLQKEVEELSARSAQLLFSTPAPASFIAAVCVELDANNDRHANAVTVQGVIPGWTEASGLTLAAQTPAPPSESPCLVAIRNGQSNQTEHGLSARRTAVLLWAGYCQGWA